ncbi:MAG: enoyl-CoA hydratase-related protein [Pseudomonadota bacterium]
MEYQAIKFWNRNGVATITLKRPDVMNALNTQMRAELTHAVKDLQDKARVIVVTGQGKSFCSGQDLGDGGNAANLDLERTLRDEYVPMLRAIVESKVPTIAAVNGAAAGAGANLALCFDVVLATESAYFVQAFTRIGLIPDAGGTFFLPRQVGTARAMGASLFADKISARQAADWGMIYECIPDDDFAQRWQDRAMQLANGPTKAYQHLKEAMKASAHNDFEHQLAVEAKMQGKCGQTRDFQEGVVAFLEKRPAVYEGR